MPDRPTDALHRELGGRVPAGLAKLTPADREKLAEAIREARRRQRHALGEAGDRALRHVPRLLRGPIRKIVG